MVEPSASLHRTSAIDRPGDASVLQAVQVTLIFANDELALGSKGMTFKLVPPQMVPSEDAVLEGHADLALGLKPNRKPGILWEAICPIDLVVIARKGHPQLDGKIVADQLDGLGHATLEMNMPVQAPGAVSNAGKLVLNRPQKTRQIVRVSRPSAIPTVVSQSDLIGYYPRFAATALAEPLGLQLIEPPAPLSDMELFMMWSERADGDPGVKWMRDFIKQTILAV